jgi:hypothetical protein
LNRFWRRDGWKRFCQQPLLVYGRVAEDWGAVSLEVSKIEVLGKQSAGEIISPKISHFT